MAVKFRDYYEVLGVPRTATEENIRQEYRKLARRYHPDVNKGDQSSEEKFKEINEAYQVLSDSEKRKKYDALGSNWREGSDFSPPPGWEERREGRGEDAAGFRDFGDAFGAAGGDGSGDFFESLFGRRGGRRGTPPRIRGDNLEAEIRLTLEDAHHGVTRRITIQSAEPCPTCGGTGAIDGKTCPTCRGSGLVERPRSLDVTIPAGVHDGSIVRLAGQGEPGLNGGSAGDILLHVRLESHKLFRIEGGHLELELPVAPWEAALGAKVPVPTLDGSVEMTIREGTQGGQRLRLRGQGMNRRGGGRGDLYVKIMLVNPPKLNSKQKELYESLAAEVQWDPRELLPGR